MTSPNTLSAAITNAVLYQLMNVHTAMPARIVTYDYTTRKASVQPLVDKKFTDGTVQAMPQINNIPVVLPQVGDFSMSFPINAGDYCLIICCERSISTWLNNGQQAPPIDPRKFDLSDAVALVGLHPFTEQSAAPNNTDFILKFAGSEIKIEPSGAVSVKTASTVAIGTLTVEVLDILSQTLAAIAAITVLVPPGIGAPVPFPIFNAASFTALQALINSIKGTIT